jgi:hypothetical protein
VNEIPWKTSNFRMIGRAFLLALSVSGLLRAQQLQPGQLATDQKQARWRAMSVSEKLRHDVRDLFDVDNFVFAGIGAAIDQGRDRPSEWGQGWTAFSERYASHIGGYLVQRTIMSSVRAIDHEDPRFIRSRQTSYQRRAGDALLYTVWRHSDAGGMMPAYSEFFGDYGAAAVSRMWWPDRYHTFSSLVVAGTNTILIDAAINVLHEFTPDIKRRLHLGR